MIRQKFQPSDLVQSFDAMQFDSSFVIDVDPVFLSHCKHCFKMQKTDIVHALRDVDFAVELLRHPIESRYVTFFAP